MCCSILLLFVLADSWLVAGQVEGEVVDSTGRGIEGARIFATESSEWAATDQEGYFCLEPVTLPVRLVVSCASFETVTVFAVEHRIRITLRLEPDLKERVTVTARSESVGFSPVGAAASQISPEQDVVPPPTLSSLLDIVPGIAANGQGGLFQGFSIRGVSRHRVLTRIGSVRLTSERRPGASASFFDPLLMESVELIRGPSSTQYGSGALGGMVQVTPIRFNKPRFAAGYETQGNENFEMAGWGRQSWSFGFVRRNSGNASDPTGTRLNSHYSQYSAVFSKKWQHKGSKIELGFLPSFGNDIGKANTDFPGRTTTYPRERHLITQFSIETPSQWYLGAFVHPNDLETKVRQQTRTNYVLTNSFDLGAETTKKFLLRSTYFFQMGVDYFGRRGVDAIEREETTLARETTRSLEGAREDDLGIRGQLGAQFGRVNLDIGGRLFWIRQKNAGFHPVSETGWSGFVGSNIPLSETLELTASLGTGLRFPSLSERFYTGTTGRGRIIGNSSLESESSFNTEAGVRWQESRFMIAGFFFWNRISDYIERIEIEPDLLSYLNLTQGRIRGFEWETAFAPLRSWQVYWRGHLLSGHDGQDDPLADISPNRSSVGFLRTSAALEFGVDWQYRRAKNRVGNGEKPIESVHLVSASTRLRLPRSLSVRLFASNLLDRLYYRTADRKSPLAPGRSVGLSLIWFPD